MATPAQAAAMRNTALPVGDVANRRDPPACPARLQKNVRNIGLLWTEWTHGLQGNKPARDFTPEERGHKDNASRFSRRLPIWVLVRKLAASGLTVPAITKRIEHHYGPHTSMLKLAQLIKADARNKTLPHSLRID